VGCRSSGFLVDLGPERLFVEVVGASGTNHPLYFVVCSWYSLSNTVHCQTKGCVHTISDSTVGSVDCCAWICFGRFTTIRLSHHKLSASWRLPNPPTNCEQLQ